MTGSWVALGVSAVSLVVVAVFAALTRRENRLAEAAARRAESARDRAGAAARRAEAARDRARLNAGAGGSASAGQGSDQ